MADHLLLDAGSGGLASQRLIGQYFMQAFDNPILKVLDDAALLEAFTGKMAMSTDAYTVTPLFFPGGSIGTLAVHGTVNDVAMLGAKPKYLSCAFVLEEGLDLEILGRVAKDMGEAAKAAGVWIVTGDTKVVPKGSLDQIFITTTGIGEVLVANPPSGHAAKPGDVIVVSGSLGDHGLTIMAAREDLPFISDVRSDSAPLNGLVEALLQACQVHVLRDPTRGGFATTLNEIAKQSQVGIRIRESALPIHESVRSGCSFMGLDPLYLANEGKCLCFVPEDEAQKALAIMRSSPFGQEAAIVGSVHEDAAARVILETAIGGERLLGMLEGAQLPRIC
ncbi:MAG: hydrogenase expression/formation protein HypE [Desulfovibrio sp.]|nr:hydrogenase expression/formation protein HypE [Desulfovibrio sp.]